MVQNSKIEEFPDIGTKLTAPTKKSLFERQKAENEAKRAREQQETAAVYEDFVKSFDDADDTVSADSGRKYGGSSGSSAFAPSLGGPSKRHFSGPPAGPSARGAPGGGRGSSGPGTLGLPPPSLSRKRALDGVQPFQKDVTQGLFAFEDSADASAAFQHSDDEDEKAGRSRAHERAAPKPTIHLSSLPPGTSPAVIKSILPVNLTVDAVRILPPSGPGSLERKTLSAIVTLVKDTPAVDIDTAVSALQNRYLGWGFYLSLSRHLSSAAVGTAIPAPLGLSSSSALPFGAKPIPATFMGSLSRAPPPGAHRGGFAPPSSYTSSGPGQYGRPTPPVQVNVNPPSDLKQLKLIHKTLEALLTHGPEFEALLMSRPDVQKDEKWAWIWDPRSTGGIWYRWRLWDIITGAQSRIKSGRTRNSGSSQFVFDGGAAWAAPERVLPFEYTTSIDTFVSDTDYDSSDDEDSGEEGRRRHQHLQGGALPPEGMLGITESDMQAYLNPLQKAKLVHLLARLPTTNAKLRRGDVARVTAFAIQHAGEGAEEVVDLITMNVHTPFTFSSANPDRKLHSNPADDNKLEAEPSENTDVRPSPADNAKPPEKEDTSSAKLIALYIISDILSSSSTSGIRHAWRYRQLFEAALKSKQTFVHLGRLEKEMAWGRLRAEKWKRSVLSVLSLWEGWCAFPAHAHEAFAEGFVNPPLTRKERDELRRKEVEAKVLAEGFTGAKSKWKTVEESGDGGRLADGGDGDGMDVDGRGDGDGDGDGQGGAEDDVDGEPMVDDDEDVDGLPMSDSGEEDGHGHGHGHGHGGGDRDGDPMEDVEDASHELGLSSHGEQSSHTTHAPPLSSSAALPDAAGTRSTGLGFQDGARPGNDSLMEGGVLPGRRRRPKAEDMFADSDGE